MPQCVKCGSPVSDLVEPEIQQHGEVKPGVISPAPGYVMNAHNVAILKK